MRHIKYGLVVVAMSLAVIAGSFGLYVAVFTFFCGKPQGALWLLLTVACAAAFSALWDYIVSI